MTVAQMKTERNALEVPLLKECLVLDQLWSVCTKYQKQLEIGRYKSMILMLPQRAVNFTFQSDEIKK